MDELNVVPTTFPNVENDNSVIRALRAQIEEQKTARTAAETRATELEREKMSESERLRAEAADAHKKVSELSPLLSQVQAYETSFNSLYQAELALIPEAHRERIAKLSSHGTAADKLEALRMAKELLPNPVPAPVIAGTVTNPGVQIAGSVTASQPNPATTKNGKQLSFGEAIALRGLQKAPGS